MWNYTDKVLDHFLNPRNVGEISDANAVFEAGSIACGDALKIYLKIDDKGIIRDAKFKTFGCGSAIASASVLTELVVGKTVEEALKISNKDIAEALGGLPEEKMHCSVMGHEALEGALLGYMKKEKPEEPPEDQEGELICKCFGVHEGKIKRVVRENKLKTVEQVTNYCKAGGGCGLCHNKIEDIIKSLIKDFDAKDAQKEKPKYLTNIQRIALIQETIAREIRPVLKMDKGDLELIDVVGNKVIITLRGHCSGCPASGVTIQNFIQQKLREFVAEDIVVEEAAK